MCYTLNAKATIAQLNKKYKAGNETPEVHKVFHKLSGFNAAATAVKYYAKLPVLTATQNDVFSYMQWGLIPSWTAQEKAKSYVINNLNARSETVFEKRSFAPSLKEKRCIIPVTGFFESREINKEKYPYFIYLKNEAIFSFAGIYDIWKDEASGATIKSFSIITTEANPLMAEIHNTKKRMPVILTGENEKKWLAPTISDEEIKYLLQPLDDSLMKAHTVAKKVNNTRIDTDQPGITNLVEYPELAFYE